MIECGELNSDSASYIAQYTVKKMTASDDYRLRGRYPEFARMSLKPGIGADAMWDVASKLLRESEQEGRDVPGLLRLYGKESGIGRYLQGKLRTYVGKDAKAPPQVLDKIAQELRPLREAAFDSSSSFKKAIVDATAGRYAQIEARNLIFKGKRSI